MKTVRWKCTNDAFLASLMALWCQKTTNTQCLTITTVFWHSQISVKAFICIFKSNDSFNNLHQSHNAVYWRAKDPTDHDHFFHSNWQLHWISAFTELLNNFCLIIAKEQMTNFTASKKPWAKITSRTWEAVASGFEMQPVLETLWMSKHSEPVAVHINVGESMSKVKCLNCWRGVVEPPNCFHNPPELEGR